jgi:hypothetical protein
MGSDPIHVSYANLDDLKSQLSELGIALDNAVPGAVTPTVSSVDSGAGQFAADLGDGPDKFSASWQLWLTAVSDDCSIVGNSIGQAKIDFTAIDAAASYDQTIQL